MRSRTMTQNTLNCKEYRNFTKFSGMEILWEGTVSELWGNCAFPQNFHTRKFGEITVFFTVFTEHIVSFVVYGLSEMSIIELNNVAFTQNILLINLAHITLNSSCYNPGVICSLCSLELSTSQLNNIEFAQYSLMKGILYMDSNSTAIVQKNTFTESNISGAVCSLFEMNATSAE